MIIDSDDFEPEDVEVDPDSCSVPSDEASMSPRNTSPKAGRNKGGKARPARNETIQAAGTEAPAEEVPADQPVPDPASPPSVSPGMPAEMANCLDEGVANLDCPGLFINREINWLEFNARVLECALDSSAPLLEQLKFLCIFYNNLDEFFMVRVANVFLQYRSGSAPTGPDRMSPARQLAEIRRRVMTLTGIGQEHWRRKLRGALADRGLKFTHYADLSEKQRRFLADFFNNEIYPVLTPQAIDPSHPFPTISNLSINFLIQLRDRNGSLHFARVRCPGNVPRLIFVPRGKEGKSYAQLGLVTNMRDTDILLLEDLVQEYLGQLFPGYKVVSSGCFRITRNTDVEIEEDEADDLLQAVKDLVDQRRFGDVVRLESAHGMPSNLREFLFYNNVR